METYDSPPVNVRNGGSLSYRSYVSLLDKLVDERDTTGEPQQDWMATFTAVNFVKMQRLYKRLHLQESLMSTIKSIRHPQKWVIITESWSGDAAYAVPVFVRAAELNPLIELKIVLPDSGAPEIEKFHRLYEYAVPNVLIFEGAGNLVGQWGPRPKALQQVFSNCSKEEGSYCDPLLPYAQVIDQWYREDGCRSIQKELEALLTNAHVKTGRPSPSKSAQTPAGSALG